MIDTEVEVFLKHFGVKGMHWGVHNEPKKAKIFAPTTKEERQRIRRSKSAHEGRVFLGKAVASISVGVGAGIVARKIALKKYSYPIANLIGIGTSTIGTHATARILDLNGTRKAKSLKK